MNNNMIMNVKNAVEQLGDEEFYFELVDEFIETAPRKFDNISSFIESEDFEHVRTEAHALKGLAANLYLIKLKESAVELEMAAKNCNLEGVSNFLIMIQNNFNDVVALRREKII